MVWRSSVSAVVAVAVSLASHQAQAFQVTLVNSCSDAIDVFDSKSTETLSVGGTSTRTVSPGGAYVYRKGTGGQATLAEFSADNNAAWYDISIIPTGEGKGPGNCGSLEECKSVTCGVGFNVAMSIEPSQTDGNRCVALTCMEDGCADAYQYPADDSKTHSCSSSVDFTVTFCPGGSSGAAQTFSQIDTIAGEAQNYVQQQWTSPPTTAPPAQQWTPAPTEAPATEAPATEAPVTEAPATEAPATEAPATEAPATEAPTWTPEPTTEIPATEAPVTTTPPPMETPVLSSTSASAPGDADAGDNQWNDFVGKVGGDNATSASSDGVAVGQSQSAGDESANTPEPISYQKSGTVATQTLAPAVQTSGNADGSVEQANTQSASSGSGGTVLSVVCIGAAVGVVAVVAVMAIRKKKQALEEEMADNKTPAFSMRAGAADHNVLMTSTNDTSAVL